MLMRTALLLSTLSLAISGCETTKRSVEALRPDLTNADRFVCDRSPDRPKLPPEYQIDWGRVAAAPNVAAAVDLAKQEHAQFIARLRTRENITVGYIVVIDSVNFVCFNNMKWQRDFYAGLGQSGAPQPNR
jgi:hypothetical protein